MSRDFLTNRTRTKAIIGSGAGAGNQPTPKLVIYSDSDATDNSGGISNSFDTVLDDTNYVGNDVFLYVSGTINGKANGNNNSVSVFGGDVVVSGTLYAESQIIELDVNSTSSLNVSGTITAEDLILTSGSINIQSGSINIGPAEDNDYTDGLFTDFTPSTAIGTAVDRFNEVLKALAPSPAPNLDQFDVDISNGISAKVSFGTSNDQSASNPAYFSIDTASGYSAKDVNDTYGPESASGGNYRLGIFNGTQIVSGTLNEDVTNDTYSNNIVNYPDNAFGSADQGSLKLFLNGNEIHSTDLTVFTSGNDLNGNSSGFKNLIAATSGKFASDTDFNNFKYRTGEWQVGIADQVNGRNYVQVKHVIGASETVTGFAEWVNDNNSDALTISSNSLGFTGSGSKYLSGVQYFTGGSVRYTANVDNVYKYIYSSNPITFSVSSSPSNMISISNQSIPDINTLTEDHTKVLSIDTNSINLSLPSNNKVLGGTITVGCNVSHPLKSDLTGAVTQSTASQILIYNVASSSNNLTENFNDENYRLISGDYLNQTDVSGNTNNWDSTQQIISTNTGYSNGLLTYDGKLVSTKNNDLVNSGNFSTLTNGPVNNPDYSNGNISAGTKYYYRKIQNTTGNPIRDLSYTLNGLAVLNSHSSALGTDTNNFKIHFKVPGTSAWLDAATLYDYHEISIDGDGGAATTPTTSIGSSNITNNITFGIGEVANNDYIVFRVSSNKSWKGNLDNLSFTLGLTNTNAVTSSPVLSQINGNSNGVNGKLSFGTSNSVSTYSNVTNLVNNAVDANQSFNSNGSTRLGIFNGSTNISGRLNDQVSSNGNNYPADSWGGGLANKGTLDLEVNGVSLTNPPIDLTVMGSLNSTHFNLTEALPGKNTNNIPDHRYYYRTGTYNIPTNYQRNGWNYAKVTHNDGSNSRVTNYVEWVNNASNQIAFSNLTIDTGSITQGTTSPNYLSGIGYFVNAKGNFSLTASNVYKNIYSDSNSAITFPTTTRSNISSITVNGTGVINGVVNSSSRSLPNLDTGATNPQDQDIDIEAAFNFDSFTTSLPGNLQTATLNCRILHPISANSATSNNTTSPSPLMYTVNDTETDLVENFSAESYRLISGTYNNQSDVNSGTWDSTQSLIGSNTGHNSGLQFYNNELVAPNINFNNTSSMVGPQNNPDYSTATGTRTFYRKFENTTQNSQFGFNLLIKGTGTNIAANNVSLTTNNIHVFAKIPNTTNSQSTGFMDLALPFNTGQTNDNDGCLQGTLTSAISNSGSGTSNTVTFGTKFLSPGDFVVLKIEADSSWTGDLNRIEVIWS